MDTAEGSGWNPNAQRIDEGIKTFVLAGNSTFTLVSMRTQKRFTYKVTKDPRGPRHYVKVLSGPHNETDYGYLGTIFDSNNYKHGRKSMIGVNASSVLAFEYFWGVATRGGLAKELEFWHEGKCGKCSRKLTVPESIKLGIGPICFQSMANYHA